jgi:glycosyltransferase involved in cell wall biosynthesis
MLMRLCQMAMVAAHGHAAQLTPHFQRVHMFDNNATESALLVADLPGHILERIGLSWIRHANGVHHELIHSVGESTRHIVRRAHDAGLVHWIDRWGFMRLGAGTVVPQVVMVHHLTDAELPDFLRLHQVADAITTVSQRWRTKLHELTGRDIVLIPNTVDSSIFRPLPDRLLRRRKEGIDDRTFAIGFVAKAIANTSNRKGLDLLLRVLQIARSKWIDICLILVGPGWKRVVNDIKRLDMRVITYEFTTTYETASVYPLMDTYVVTSSEEGGPCTLLEAMACGVPCITSNVGHVPEVIIDGNTGFICPDRTPEEYIERISVLKHARDIRTRIGAQAREFIKREREEHAVIPKMDFRSIYANARRRFHDRHTAGSCPDVS